MRIQKYIQTHIRAPVPATPKVFLLSFVIEWLRIVESIKLQVSFAKEPYKNRQYSAKETYNLIDPADRSHPIPCCICVYVYVCVCMCVCVCILCHTYGVATISRLLKIIGLFCRISSLLQGSFAKETYNLKEPTNHSHPITIQDTHDLCDICVTHVIACEYTENIYTNMCTAPVPAILKDTLHLTRYTAV